MDVADIVSVSVNKINVKTGQVERIRKYGSRSNAIEVISDVDLTGRTILVTGTTSGIGTETARALALRGAHVIMANRNIVMSEQLKNKILIEKVGICAINKSY
uniref:SDR family NAD(P)-dependent oxidoreductase n=1 Tax=Heterorhabditis bacteriophora TaxID=37862 RepID=A0A1I7WRQ8_HETBA